MQYKLKEKENYTLHIINTDRFKHTQLLIRFTKKYTKEEACYYHLLSKVMNHNRTKKYSLKDLYKKYEELYSNKINYNSFTISNNIVFEEGISFLDYQYTSINIVKEIIKLFKEVIINQREFDEDLFNSEKEELIKAILRVKDSIEDYASLKFSQLFYKNTIYAENYYKNIDIIKNINKKILYKKYLELFTNFKIDVFVLGNIDENIYEDLIEEVLRGFKQKIDYNNDLYLNIEKQEDIVKEEYNSTQSNLVIGLNIDSLTLKEINYTLLLYNTILGNMNNSLLFLNVREKNSLCYYIASNINRFTSTIVINSGINKDNFNSALSIIKETLESMKDEKTIEKHIVNGKKLLEIAFNDFYDNSKKMIDYYYLKEFIDIPFIEDRRKNILNLTSKDIALLARKISIGLVYLLEGVQNEEN